MVMPASAVPALLPLHGVLPPPDWPRSRLCVRDPPPPDTKGMRPSQAEHSLPGRNAPCSTERAPAAPGTWRWAPMGTGFCSVRPQTGRVVPVMMVKTSAVSEF